LTEQLEDRRRLELGFEHARFHDTFTGLPNRRYFMQRLDQALHDRGGRGQLLAIILLDIDRFRLVNDTLGQTAGDELMVQAARRFENKMGTDVGHVLARWSGDQFAVLLFDVHSRTTAVTFAKLLSDALVNPFILRRHALSVAAHIGITCVDTELQRTEDVVREADIALSVAKGHEAKNPVVYEAALGELVVSTVSLEADLHVALEREQFRLLFQPIVDLATGSVVGAEALLRWHHPVEGLLATDRFLSIAEDARLIVPISRWVIRRACGLASEWRRFMAADTSCYVSIDLAATAR
jgi:diguanylate cyclase (GGDEF)-like protein